jgi:biotin carboxyl carrier protein
MKYTVTIDEKIYAVEIEDINARPVVAHVEGRRYEVTPENHVAADDTQPDLVKEASSAIAKTDQSQNTIEITAPLPGLVLEVFVKDGDEIEAGQVILIIEAMKMKNSIRSTRGGTIAEVLVEAGRAVAHKQSLVRFK